jgi:hypothetical protein
LILWGNSGWAIGVVVIVTVPAVPLFDFGLMVSNLHLIANYDKNRGGLNCFAG